MTDHEKALACLAGLRPSNLTYDQWLSVGMALQHAGCTAGDWERWSASDPEKYKSGECARKWNGFRNSKGSPVTVGTLIELCRECGELPEDLWGHSSRVETGGGFGWDDFLPSTSRPLIDPHFVESADVPAPAKDWEPVDFVRYLEAMFQPNERVGICMTAQSDGEKHRPHGGFWDRTAGELIELVKAGELSDAIGDTHAEAGAWVVINPLDGKGRKDDNVKAYRHALLESDDDDLGKQLALIREMQLPVSAIVHSGAKSIHALVRVDAKDLAQYRERVNYLYKVAERYGLTVDEANRNPSRLSRLPGLKRGEAPQYLIGTRGGVADWEAWVAHVEDGEDGLPAVESLDLTNIPDLSPEVVRGLARKGDKLVVTGPSGAGKSFALIQLAIAVAEGAEWLGFECARGSVLYVNMELQANAAKRRFRDVYRALGVDAPGSDRIDLWNLRGHSAPLDKMAGKIIRRAKSKQYSLLILDPIYKLAMGDENDAEDMGKLCQQMDRLAEVLGCAVAYAHHHTKGSQGAKKAMDRASGSGVIARDADAMLDFVELELSADRRAQVEDRYVCEALDAYLGALPDGNPIDRDQRGPADGYLLAAQQALKARGEQLADVAFQARQAAKAATGWRVECGKVREYARPPLRRYWFRFPVHARDGWELLTDAKAAGEEPPWKAEREIREAAVKEKAKSLKAETIAAVEACGGAGEAKIEDVAAELGIGEKAARDRVVKSGKYRYHKGLILERKERAK